MVFFCTYLYAFAKQHGTRWREQLATELGLGPRSNIPAIRTWAACTNVDHVTLSVSGPCRLAPARSQDAARFLQQSRLPHRGPDVPHVLPCDVCVMSDDDMETNDEGMRALVAACRTTRGFVVAPCLQRDAARKADDPGICNIRVDLEEAPDVFEGDGFRLARIKAPGMGLVAIHADVFERMTAAHPELLVRDAGSGFEYHALFFEMIAEGHWLGEDMSFGRRMRALGVPMHALLDVEVDHAGRRMVLELDEGGRLAMRVFDVAR